MAICGECGQMMPPAVVQRPQTVNELELEMVKVEELMMRLVAHRSRLRRSINSLAPVAQLPSEILTEIFSFACTSTTPLLLGSICSSWRRLAWNAPLLWRQITLHITPNFNESKLHLLLEWLERAHTTPLHIKLFTTEEDDATFFSLRSVMEVLVARSTYWGSIECLLPPQCHDLLSDHLFPALTNVLFRPPKGTISTFSRPPRMLENTPLLTDVDLSGYDFSSMSLPWAQLRKFRTQFLTVFECLRVLQQSPRLVHCILENVYSPDILNFSGVAPNSRFSKAQLVHAGLETLDVTFIKGSAMSFLDMISLPSLKDLCLHYAGTEIVPFLPVISLVSRSSVTCSLTKLSISRCVFAEEDLIRCLEALPMLVELSVCVREVTHSTFGGGGLHGLSIGREGMSESFVRRLYCSRSKLGVAEDSDSVCGYLLPKLQRFSYEGLVLCPISVILDMSDWRWSRSKMVGMARLRRVTISSRWSLDMTRGEARRLEGLLYQGMQLCIFQS